MLTVNELKYYASLLQKKYRTAEKKFLVEGRKLVEEGLNSAYECGIVILTAEFAGQNPGIINFIKRKSVRYEIIKARDFNKLCDTKTPQGIAAVFKMNNDAFSSNHKNAGTIIALENISDPGNLGAIIRTCDWFGFDNIILSGDCADIYNPKVLRAAMGSVFHLDIKEEKDFYTKLKELKQKKFAVFCADIEGENIFKCRIENKKVIAFSNEANGPSEKLLNLTDKKITIPKMGKAESLNVASAAAIILADISFKFS